MQNARTYRREPTGSRNQWLTFYTPVFTRTATGGDRVQWVEWRTCKGQVKNISGNEAVDADRSVAVNTKGFTILTLSTPGINETMMLKHDGQYYEIKRLDKSEQLPRNQYTEITATRRDTSASPVEFLSNAMYMDYAEKFANVTAAYVTVTAGTLPDITERTAAEIHQLLHVYRSGLRLTYGNTTDDGFSINNSTNRITPVLSFAGENVLVHQYAAT
jgi:SPP1 family predicted phage head-tail adaptor